MGYKILIVLTVIVFMFIAGYYTYIFLNKKIKESNGILELLFYSIALFIGLGVVYFGGLLMIVKVYSLLMSNE